MTVLVTGGSGRLGRSVLQAWQNAGETVVNLDRAPSGIAGVHDRSIDLLDADATARAFDEIGAEVVIHLAGIAVPFAAPENQILSVNVGLAHAVLGAAANSGARRVLLASSPTVMGYGSPSGWRPEALPLDESQPTAPWHAYGASKVAIEALVGVFARSRGQSTRYAAFRPCYVITPEEWNGAPTQQGHTVTDRLDDPQLAAVSLFNYVDARDAAEFTRHWAERVEQSHNGRVYFVGAADALAVEPLATLIPRFSPELVSLARGLTGTAPAFSTRRADRDLGWRPTRSWRTELAVSPSPTTTNQGATR